MDSSRGLHYHRGAASGSHLSPSPLEWLLPRSYSNARCSSGSFFPSYCMVSNRLRVMLRHDQTQDRPSPGIYLSLYYQSVRLLQKKTRMKYRKFYIIYSSLLLLFLSIALATNCGLGDLMWIDDRDVPGGPPAYYQNNISDWYNTLGTAADVAALAMADGLMVSAPSQVRIELLG